MGIAWADTAGAEPTTTTTADPSGEAVRAALMGDEGVQALGMVLAFGVGAVAGQAMWGRSA